MHLPTIQKFFAALVSIWSVLILPECPSVRFLRLQPIFGSYSRYSDGLSVDKCKKKSPCFVSKHEDLVGAPWGIRTHDLLIRSQTLYPAELRAHVSFSGRCSLKQLNQYSISLGKKQEVFSSFFIFFEIRQTVWRFIPKGSISRLLPGYSSRQSMLSPRLSSKFFLCKSGKLW